MTHRGRAALGSWLFDGDENVIVDFKFSKFAESHLVVRPSPERFLTPADAEQFRKHPGRICLRAGLQVVYQLIATIASEKFGFNTSRSQT